MESLSLLNLMITICLVIGGIAAYRHGFARTASEVQERVIHALQGEIQSLHDRITALERENTRLEHTITTICSALKQRGIHVTIDGDIVSIQDHSGGSYTYSTRVYSTQETQEEDPLAKQSDARSPTEDTIHRTASTAARRRSKRRAAQEQEGEDADRR